MQWGGRVGCISPQAAPDRSPVRVHAISEAETLMELRRAPGRVRGRIAWAGSRARRRNARSAAGWDFVTFYHYPKGTLGAPAHQQPRRVDLCR